MEIRNRYQYPDGYTKVYLEDGRVMGEHRFIKEQELGRKLEYNEVVHHQDEVKPNNDPGNLEIMTRSDHARLHQKTGRTMVRLVCAGCGKEFEREVRHVAYKLSSGIQQDFYCNRSCQSRRNHE